jgi:isoquinoline 1-oxidoreductase alpha subunit
MAQTLNINGVAVTANDPADMPLLWFLRDRQNLTGTKYGCGIALCGACTVLIDGEAQRSCQVTIGEAAGRAVTTIEGLAGGGALHPLQQAWIDEQAPQCGYCQSGMILAAAALLQATRAPTDAEIDAAITNICRCGTYPRVRAAIRRAAKAMAGEEPARG